MTQLEATLDGIVGKLRGNGFPNEQSISQGVVLRVLRDLNWDIYDTDIVWPEYKVPSSQRGRLRALSSRQEAAGFH